VTIIYTAPNGGHSTARTAALTFNQSLEAALDVAMRGAPSV